MLVADLNHFLDMPDDGPGPARQLARHLEMVVRAATAGSPCTPWTTALMCRRRPGRQPCPGHIAVYRPDPPDRIEWGCTACGDDGVISGWEDSPVDLRGPRSASGGAAAHEIVLTEESVAALQDLQLLDTGCERLVFAIRTSGEGPVLTASAEELDELLGFVAAEANLEDNRRRQKRLDAAIDLLTEAQEDLQSPAAATPATTPTGRATQARPGVKDITGRWRILETDLWDLDDLDLVEPAFIEFGADKRGRFELIPLTGWMDWRPARTDSAGVEFSWEGWDEGDQVSGRGWAALEADGSLRGHIYFHLGDDSGFRAVRPNPDVR